jgi:hypothetical protein
LAALGCHEFQDSIEGARQDEGLGNIADSDAFFVTFKKGEGSIDSQLFDQALGYIMSSLLGAKPVTTGGNPYTHTFTLARRTSLSPSRCTGKIQIAATCSLVQPSTPEDDCCQQRHRGLHRRLQSKTAKDWAIQTPSYTTLGAKFLQQHLQFRLATTIGGLAGASETVLKNLELTINRNTTFDQNLGTVEPTDILAQELSVEGHFSST